MAQSFLANAATRLHPTEWSTGVAAGAAAVLMTQHATDWTRGTEDMLLHVRELQDILESPAVGSPLHWTFV